MTSQCPGQDKRFWKAEDIFDAPCAHCGAPVEFWKDDKGRKCRACGEFTRNPRFDLGCAEWCKMADECLGVAVAPAGDNKAGACGSEAASAEKKPLATDKEKE